MDTAWVEEFKGAVTVCDTEGIILDMNQAAALLFEKDGGKGLIGSNVLDCHPEPARTKLKKLMEKEKENVYTIGKKGEKRLIYQTPWYVDGRYMGFVEVGLPLPTVMPHFNRDSF